MTIILPSFKEPNAEIMASILTQLYPSAQIIIVNDSEGRGKGWALRQGVLQAKSLPIVFIDADMDIRPYELGKILPHLAHYDIVVGKKELPSSFKRRFITLLSRLWIRLLFGIKVDTQTGLKGFNYKPTWKTNGWAFDIEIIYMAIKAQKLIIEIPIKATVSDSKTFKDIWTTLIDSLKIRLLS